MVQSRTAIRLSPLLALPVLVYLGVVLFWQSHGLYRITGDEPHYLLITESLVRDHDLQVGNNYSTDNPVRQAAMIDLAKDLAAHSYNNYSRHTIAMPFLLTIPYAIAGVSGAKVFLALCAGLWPLLLFKMLFEITRSRAWSLITALTLAIGLPFSAGSNQVYPDLLAGTVILFVTWKIFNLFRAGSSVSTIESVSIGVLIFFLPWLHVRLAPTAVLLSVAYAYAIFRASSASFRRLSRWRLAIPAGLGVCSVILLSLYHRVTFGTVSGPFGESYFRFRLKEIGMLFFGLHWDQSQGMFIQQPLLLLGLIGIPALIKEHTRGAILLALVYCSVIVPAAMHPAFYGGHSFFGRFWWPVVALWVFPMGFAIRSFARRNAVALALVCLTAIAWQAWLASKWLFHDGLMLNRSVPVWASRSFFDKTSLWRYLPAFRDLNAYLKHPANYVFVLAGFLLVISAWLWSKRRPRLVAVWGVFMLIAATGVALIPPSLGSLKLTGIDLPSEVGRVEDYDRTANEKDHQGWLTYGPYTMLMPGLYDVTVEYDSDAAQRFDTVRDPGINVISGAELPPSNANGGVFTCEFSVSEEQALNALYEFRVGYAGHGDLRFKKLTITPISFDY